MKLFSCDKDLTGPSGKYSCNYVFYQNEFYGIAAALYKNFSLINFT